MTELVDMVTQLTEDNKTIENSTSGVELTPTHTNNYAYLLLLLLSLAGITGNLLVILAISTVNKLKSNTNLILASLAIADLLVCTLVMPLGVLHLITGVWVLGDVACSMYLFLDVYLCTCSILHMCTISFDRYLGIAYPLRYTNFRTKRATWLKIAGTWSLAAALACPILILAFTDRNSIYLNGACVINNQAFQIYGSMCAFYIPLIAMCTTYLLTIRKLKLASQLGNDQTLRKVRGNKYQRKHGRQSYSKESSSGSFMSGNSFRVIAAENAERNSGSSQRSASPNPSHCDWEKGEKFGADTNNNKREQVPSNLTEKRKKLVGHKLSCSDYPTSMPLLTTSADSETMPENNTLKVKYFSTDQIAVRRSVNELTGSRSYDTLGRQIQTKWKRILNKANMSEMLAKFKSKKAIISQMEKEQKATQVLGCVFLAFVVSWLPFFAINLVQPACGERCQLSDLVMNFVLWLGYSASIANPIIYTIINKEFQKAFRDLLTCRLWLRRRNRYTITSCISNLNEQVVVVSSALVVPQGLPSTSQ